MKKEIKDALDLLAVVTGQLQTTRDTHLRIQAAIRLIQENLELKVDTKTKSKVK